MYGCIGGDWGLRIHVWGRDWGLCVDAHQGLGAHEESHGFHELPHAVPVQPRVHPHALVGSALRSFRHAAEVDRVRYCTMVNLVLAFWRLHTTCTMQL